ncbi:metalloendopeptidase [Madurella fahalii]|uniref:Metalloendopeptidase n=1 Tax=Madurella fahalii TaxID=1157608 RepID=A0ABQ0GLL4_9PEZI
MEPSTTDTGSSRPADQSSCSLADCDAASSVDSGIGLADGYYSHWYTYEFGRRYLSHTYQPGAGYFCPTDEQEDCRQDLQSHVFDLLFHGRQYFAPLSSACVVNVLDLCSGTGIWALDVAEEHPSWNVRGVDLRPCPLMWTPPNLFFQIDDICLPWTFGTKFDYIHTRATLYMGCWSDFKKEVVQRAYDTLQPGGWFESQEVGSLVASDDGTLPPHGGLASWVQDFNTAGSLTGRPRDVAGSISQWYMEVGFVDVRHTTFKLPIGQWPMDPRQKELGAWWAMTLETALSGLSVRLFHEAFGRETAETEIQVIRATRDIRNRSIHAYSTVHVVCGRKPLTAKTGESDIVASEPGEGPETNSRGDLTPIPSSSRESPSSLPLPELSCSSSTACSGASVAEDASSSTDESASGFDGNCWEVRWFQKQRQDFINRIMRGLCQFLDSKIADTHKTKSHGATSSPRPPNECGETSAGRGSGSREEDQGRGSGTPSHIVDTARQRRAESRDQSGDGGDDVDDGDNRRRKRPRTESSDEPRRFACPYYKRNPKRYSKWTSCPGPGWDEVHRVKAHLYRRHALPLQCPRCWEPFRADCAFREHLQQDPPCTVQTDQKFLDGFTKEQEKMLRSRKKVRPGMTEAEKWREVYKILFPDDDFNTMPSPYYENVDGDGKALDAVGGMEDYTVFLRREMPGLVRRELEMMFQNELREVEESLRPRIEQMIVGLQPRLLRMFQESANVEHGQTEPERHEAHQGDDALQEGSLLDSVREPDFDADPSLSYDCLADVEETWGWGCLPSDSAGELEPGSSTYDINFEKLLDTSLLYANVLP